MDGMFMERGRTALERGITPTVSEDDELQRLFILDGLLRTDCFDFDYTPAPGDLLTFHRLGPFGCTFRFDGTAWAVSEEENWSQVLEHGLVELGAERDLPTDGPWADLLANPLDSSHRAIACDWLYEHGHPVLARWLQMEEQAHLGEAPAGFRETASKVSLRLRAPFVRARLPCSRKKCPGDWSALPPGDNPVLRACSRCGRKVELAEQRGQVDRALTVASPSRRAP
jgi:hypothetical protein